MKKIFGALMIAACFGMVMPVQAQIHFGVKGGLNLSKASLSNVGDNFKKDNFTGFFIGPMAEFTIPIVGLGVDASLLFAQRGIKVSDEDGDITVKQNGIDIPVTGIKLVTTAMFNNTCNVIKVIIPITKSLANVSLELSAITNPRQINSANNKITNNAPTKPSSSHTIEKIKSLWASGIYKCF